MDKLNDPFASYFSDEEGSPSKGLSDPFAEYGEPAPAKTTASFDTGAEGQTNEDVGLGEELWASWGRGSNSLLSGIGSLYGMATGDMDNWAREQGERGREYWSRDKSGELKTAEAERATAINAAEGELGKAGAAVWNTIKDPRLLANFLVEQTPMFVPGAGAGRLAGAGATALGAGANVARTAATVAGVGSGTALHTGDVVGGAYDDIVKMPQDLWDQNEDFNRLVQGGVSAEEAKRQLALEYTRGVAPLVAGASLLSQALPGGRAIEKALAGSATKQVGSSVIGRMAGAGLGEAASESTEEVSGQVLANIAKQNLDPTQSLWEGTGEAGGLGAIGGFALGAPAGLAGEQVDGAAKPGTTVNFTDDDGNPRTAEVIGKTQSGTRYKIRNPDGTEQEIGVDRVSVRSDTGGSIDNLISAPLPKRPTIEDPVPAGADPLSESIRATGQELNNEIDSIVGGTEGVVELAPQEEIVGQVGSLSEQIIPLANIEADMEAEMAAAGESIRRAATEVDEEVVRAVSEGTGFDPQTARETIEGVRKKEGEGTLRRKIFDEEDVGAQPVYVSRIVDTVESRMKEGVEYAPDVMQQVFSEWQRNKTLGPREIEETAIQDFLQGKVEAGETVTRQEIIDYVEDTAPRAEAGARPQLAEKEEVIPAAPAEIPAGDRPATVREVARRRQESSKQRNLREGGSVRQRVELAVAEQGEGATIESVTASVPDADPEMLQKEFTRAVKRRAKKAEGGQGEMFYAAEDAALDIADEFEDGFTVNTRGDGTVLVVGDSAEIRARLPGSIKGRPNKAKTGLLFSHNQAPRVIAAMRKGGVEEAGAATYGRGGQVLKKKPMKDGKYVGAPAVANTPGKITAWRKKLKSLAEEGSYGKDWYHDSAKAVLEFVDGNLEDARAFIALLSIYSPQAKVDANTTFALRAWAQYKAGLPVRVKTGTQDEKAQKALAGDPEFWKEFWSGEKTGNFYRNLMKGADPEAGAEQGATIDLWMIRAGEYTPTEAPNEQPNAGQYAFMEDETNRIAGELGWSPEEVQAAIWVAMKSRMENESVKKETERTSEKKGWISFKREGGKKTRIIHDADKHSANWIKHAREHIPDVVDKDAAGFHYGHGVVRHLGQISWEPKVSTKVPDLPGVHTAPYEQQLAYFAAIKEALFPGGKDELAKKVGILVQHDYSATPGVWEGTVSPSGQIPAVMAPGKAGAMYTNFDTRERIGEAEWVAAGKPEGFVKHPGIDNAQFKLLEVYSAAIGLVLKQDGVGFHRMFVASSRVSANAVEFKLDRPLAPDEAKALESQLRKDLNKVAGSDTPGNDAGIITTPTGVRVVNFGAVSDNKLFQKTAEKSFEDAVDQDAEVLYGYADGTLVGNNWEESTNGQDYVTQINDRGRSDIVEYANTVLRPRVEAVNREFAEEFGWGEPGVSLDVATEEGGGSPTYGTPREGAVSAQGIHHSTAQRTELDSTKYGGGIKGAERTRLALPGADLRIRNRTYFYVDEGQGVVPEAGLGPHPHHVQLENLYDGGNDPLNLATRAKQAWPNSPGEQANEFDRLVIEAGFDGIYVPGAYGKQGGAVLLGKHKVPVKPGMPAESRAPTRERSPRDAIADRLSNSSLPGGRMRASAWAARIKGTDFDSEAAQEALAARRDDVLYRSDLADVLAGTAPEAALSLPLPEVEEISLEEAFPKVGEISYDEATKALEDVPVPTPVAKRVVRHNEAEKQQLLDQHMNKLVEGNAASVAKLKPTQNMIVRAMERFIGKEIVIFTGGPAEGMASGRLPDVIFVKVNAEQPMLTTVGHEFLHQIRNTNLDLYMKVMAAMAAVHRMDRILSIANQQMQVRNRIMAERGMNVRPLGIHAAIEEVIADLVGASFSDPAFWQKLAEETGSSFAAKLAGKWQEFLQSALTFLKATTPRALRLGWIQDIRANNDVVLEMMREIRETMPTEVVDAGVAADVREDLVQNEEVSLDLDTDTSMEAPKKTAIAYKMFRAKGGKLYPLFIDANTPTTVGEWVKAIIGDNEKSKIGKLALRPGWHAGDSPAATHIGGRNPGDKGPSFRKSDQVWAEVEVPADVDWQSEANARAKTTKDGRVIPRTAEIKGEVPLGGHYRYKTNPNMQGEWIIAGGLKVNRILSDAEVEQINAEAGVEDLPRKEPLDLGALGFDDVTLDINSDAFEKWFGDSKILDENGKPQVMYHGTRGDIQAFDKEKIRADDYDSPVNGFWFSSDPDTSPAMIDPTNVMPVYLSIKNPAPAATWRSIRSRVWEDRSMREGARSYSDEARYRLQEQGYDGYLFEVPVKVDKDALSRKGELKITDASGRTRTLKIEQRPEMALREITEHYNEIEVSINGDVIGTSPMTPYGVFSLLLQHKEKIGDVDAALLGAVGAVSAGDLGQAKAGGVGLRAVEKSYTSRLPSKTGEMIDVVAMYQSGQHVIDYETVEEFESFHNTTVAVAFEPNQIKSAVGNRGTYDPNQDDVTLDVADEPGWEPPVALGMWDRIRIVLQDKYLPLVMAQDAIKASGRTIRQAADARNMQKRYPGVVKSKLVEFEQIYLEPVQEFMRRTKHSAADVGRYLMARHILLDGVNARLESINPDREDNTALSGMTDAEAQAVVDRYAGDPDMRRIGLLIDRMNNEKLQLLVDEGVLAQSEADKWMAVHEHYMPLMREDVGHTFAGGVGGGGFQQKGKLSKIRGGSHKPLDFENALGSVFGQYEAALIRIEKNRVAGSLYQLAQDHPDPEFWETDNFPLEKTIKDGVIEYVPNTMDPGMIPFKVDGETKWIWMKTQNEVAAALAKNWKNEDVGTGPILGKALRPLMGFMRFQSMINTSLSPEFVISNFMRDLQTAGITMQDTEAKGHTVRVLKGVLPSIKGIGEALFTKKPVSQMGEYATLYKEMEKAGGTMGWITHYEDVAERSRAITKAVTRGRVMGGAIAVLDFIGDVNQAVENGVRLSAYKTTKELLIDQGMTEEDAIAKAAVVSRELTVDFQQKGSAGSLINAAYLFYNASVQGTFRLARAAVSSKKAQIGLAGIALLSFTAHLAAMLDDDDDEYKMISSDDRERNLIVPSPIGEGFIKIPLGWGLNVFGVIGQEAADAVLYGMGEKEDYSIWKSGGRLSNAMMNAFNPVHDGSLLLTMSPTIIDPFTKVLTNTDWHGGSLYPDWVKDRADYLKYFRTASEPAQKITETLARWTTKADGTPVVDISPETVDMVYDTLTGSMGRFYSDLVGTGADILTGEIADREVKKLPLIRKLWKEVEDSDKQRYAYELYNDFAASYQAFKDNDDNAKWLGEYGTPKMRAAWNRYKVLGTQKRKLSKSINQAITAGNKELEKTLRKRQTEVLLNWVDDHHKIMYGD